jgi:hypothetical protein
LVEGRSGLYFEDCEEALPYTGDTRRGLAPYAVDPEAAAQLWKISEETLKVQA